MEDRILALWNELSIASHNFQAAQDELIQISYEPESLLALLSIANNSKEQKIRQRSSVLFGVSAKNCVLSYSQSGIPLNDDFISTLIHLTFEVISKEPISEYRSNYANSVQNLLSCQNLDQTPLLDFSQQIISSSNKQILDTAIIILGLLIGEQQNRFTSECISSALPILPEFLLSGQHQLCISAIQFISNAFQNLEEQTIQNVLSPIFPIFHTYLQSLISRSNSESNSESAIFFDFLCGAFNKYPSLSQTIFGESLPPLISLLQNSDISNSFRQIILYSLSTISSRCPSIFISNLSECLSPAITFGLEIAHKELYDIFQSSFLEYTTSLASLSNFNPIETNQIVSNTFSAAFQQLTSMNEPAAAIIIIILIQALVEGAPSIAVNMLQNISEETSPFQVILGTVITSGLPPLIDGTSALFETIATSPFIQATSIPCSILSTFRNALFPHVSNDAVLRAIQSLYEASEGVPSDYLVELINVLLNDVISNSDHSQHPLHRSIICDVIAAAVDSSDEFPEELFEPVFNFLRSLSEEVGYNRGKALLAFSAISQAAPDLSRDKAVNMASLAGEVLSIKPDDVHNCAVIQDCAEAVSNLLKVFPQTLAPISVPLFDTGTNVLSTMTNPSIISSIVTENTDAQKETEYFHNTAQYRVTIGTLAKMSSNLIGLYYTELSDKINNFIAIISSLLPKKDQGFIGLEEVQLQVYSTIYTLVDAIIQLQMDPIPFLTIFFESGASIEFDSVLPKFWEAVQSLMDLPLPFLISQKSSFAKLFSSILSCLNSENPKVPHLISTNESIIAFLKAISAFFADFGSNAAELVWPFSQRLIHLSTLINNENDFVITGALEVISEMIKFSGNRSADKHVPNIMSSIMPAIQAEDSSVYAKVFTCRALSNLITFSPAPFSELAGVLSGISWNLATETNDQTSSAAAIELWCALVAAYHPSSINDDELMAALDLVQLPPDFPSRTYVASFTRFAASKWNDEISDALLPIAATIIGAKRSALRRCSSEDLKFFIQIITENGPELLSESLGGNEADLIKINQNINYISTL